MDCPTCNGDRGYQSTTALGNRFGWTDCDDCDGTGLVPVKDDEPDGYGTGTGTGIGTGYGSGSGSGSGFGFGFGYSRGTGYGYGYGKSDRTLIEVLP